MMSIDKSLIVPIPWVAPAVVDFIRTTLAKIPHPNILEFGSGCSTAFFTQYQPAHLVSVEHGLPWYEFMQSYLNEHNLQVDLRLVPHNYYEECHKFSRNYFDFIFIDGKFRMACLQAVRDCDILKSGGVVMLDDSDMTPKYKVADQIMQGWAKTEMRGPKGNPLNPDEAVVQATAAWWVKP